MTGWRAGALALFLALGAVSCAARPPAGQPPGIPPVSHTSPQEILAVFDRRWQRVESLRALGRVTVTSPQGRYSTRQTLLWQRPAWLRLDTLSLFGQPVMSLVANPLQASIYYPTAGNFFQGPASAETFARVVGLPLQVSEFAPLLMGYIRPASEPQIGTIVLQTDRNLFLLRFLNGEGGLIQDAWVDPEHLLPARVLRYLPGALGVIDIAYSDISYRDDTFPVPQTLLIWLPRAATEVRIQFLSVDLNLGISPSVFQLSPPVGALIRPLP